ncbi:MAG: GAF domain-containing protein [Chloroflexota bacterium]
MSKSASAAMRALRRRWFSREARRSLRAQLVVRTILPIGLLVAAFAIFGQFGYTQVTESLVKARDGDLATVEAARMGDYLLESVQALRQVADSPELRSGDASRVYYLLLNGPVFQRFDLTQVSDASGKIIAASDGTPGADVLSREAFDGIQTSSLPMRITAATMKDGRSGVLISARYAGPKGEFGGVIEGAINLGSQRLGLPLSDLAAYDAVTGSKGSHKAVSYLVAGDGAVLWHPNLGLVGTQTTVEPLTRGPITEAGAIITKVDGQQSVIGYAPLNLGRLIPRARIDADWVQWYVVTEEKWANVVEPLNTLLFWLLALAALIFLVSLVLVDRSARTLTQPVAKLVAAASALSAGRLKQRLAITGPTEIEDLSAQFNNMADRLSESYADLEAKVEGRTRELAAANSELKRNLVESQTIQSVAANIAGTAGLAEILRMVSSSTAETLDSEGAMVFLPHEDGKNLRVASVWNLPFMSEGNVVPLNASLTGLTMITGKPQVSHSVIEDDRVYQELAGTARLRSILSVPLISHGAIVGALNAVNKRNGLFNDNDVRLLRLLADQTAVAIERAQLYADTKKQVETLETLNELALSVTLSKSVEETLLGGMEHIGKLLGASGAVVYLYNEKTRTLDFTTSYNLAPAHKELLLTLAPSVHIDQKPAIQIALLEAFQRQKPNLIESIETRAFMQAWWDKLEEHEPGGRKKGADVQLGALIAVPLSIRDKRLGTLTLYFAENRRFATEDLQMYESFAKILGLAVYNTQLIATSSRLATVEERARLARELHDSVTQSLFSLNLTLRAARRVFTSDPVASLKLLDNVHELAQGSLAEMRALIFELRPQALANEGLALALQKHADAVRARSGLTVHLGIEGDRRLPIEYEEALYQIAREALHNVVKHAQATEAWVELNLTGETAVLIIKDNGRGFDTNALLQNGGSHIGTSTMQERATAINGELQIISSHNKGTEVLTRVHIPEDNIFEGKSSQDGTGETVDAAVNSKAKETA